MIVRRIGVWSVARMYGALLAAMGLLVGLIIALVSLAGASYLNQAQSPSWIGPVFGVGAIVVLPICYGLFGIVAGAISAALYNIFAGMVGGVELEGE
jgi:hypothetical protein